MEEAPVVQESCRSFPAGGGKVPVSGPSRSSTSGLRVAAVVLVVLMALMWPAEFPLDRTAADGKPSGSANPITDYHFIYAVTGWSWRSPMPGTPGARANGGLPGRSSGRTAG